jgi:hypothetical protein
MSLATKVLKRLKLERRIGVKSGPTEAGRG